MEAFMMTIPVEVQIATCQLQASTIYRNNNSQGFNPVCFLNAVEKWEIEE